MRNIAFVLIAVSFFIMTPKAMAGFMEYNPNGDIAAYVENVVSLEHELAPWTDEALTIMFYYVDSSESFRATYYKFGSRITDYGNANGIDILEWVDNETVRVKAYFEREWDFIKGAEVFDVSLNGKTTFVRFEDVPRDGGQINPEYLKPGYSYVWDYMGVAREIEAFMRDLCDGSGTINESYLPMGIYDDPNMELYDSFEDFIGCKDIIEYVMPYEDGGYMALAVWHYYIFDYNDLDELVMVEYLAPADL